MLRRLKYKLKKILSSFLLFLIIMSVFFILGEIITRNTIGNRLIVDVEPSGMHHFEPNQFGWYGHDTIYPAKINNIGARGENVDIKNKKKVIFLGDSYTFGWRLKDDETFPYYFGNLTNDNVINFGMGGFGLDHMISSYDFHNNLFKSGDTIIVVLTEGNFYVPLSPYKSDWKKEAFWEVKRRSAFTSYIWARFSAWKASFKQDSSSELNTTVFSDENKEKLVDFNNKITNNNQNVVYVFLEHDFSDYSKEAERFCNEKNLKCITDIPIITEKVKNEGKEIFTVDGHHNSKYLNEELAKHILSYTPNE